MNRLVVFVVGAITAFIGPISSANSDILRDEAHDRAQAFFKSDVRMEGSVGSLAREDSDWYYFEVKLGYTGTIQPDSLKFNKHTSQILWRTWVEDPIGMAYMDMNGTLILTLVARQNGGKGEAQITYKKNDPDYKSVLRHVGPLAVGETKSVSPWKDWEK